MAVQRVPPSWLLLRRFREAPGVLVSGPAVQCSDARRVIWMKGKADYLVSASDLSTASSLMSKAQALSEYHEGILPSRRGFSVNPHRNATRSSPRTCFGRYGRKKKKDSCLFSVKLYARF